MTSKYDIPSAFQVYSTIGSSASHWATQIEEERKSHETRTIEIFKVAKRDAELWREIAAIINTHDEMKMMGEAREAERVWREVAEECWVDVWGGACVMRRLVISLNNISN